MACFPHPLTPRRRAVLDEIFSRPLGAEAFLEGETSCPTRMVSPTTPEIVHPDSAGPVTNPLPQPGPTACAGGAQTVAGTAAVPTCALRPWRRCGPDGADAAATGLRPARATDAAQHLWGARSRTGSLTSGDRWSDMIPACRCGCCTWEAPG